jgi:hypothetical protein
LKEDYFCVFLSRLSFKMWFYVFVLNLDFLMKLASLSLGSWKIWKIINCLYINSKI